jgi:hypothetical protein
MKHIKQYSTKKNNVAQSLSAGAITWIFNGSLTDIINRILPVFYGIVGIALFALLLYGGFTWLTSAGDPDKVRKATDTMFNAVIGVAIVMFAYLATRIIGGLFGYPFLT